MSSRKYSGHGMKMELSSSMDSKVSTVASLKFSMTMIFAVPRPTRPRRTRKTGRVHFDILMRGITGREISSYRTFNYSTRFICLHRKYLCTLHNNNTQFDALCTTYLLHPKLLRFSLGPFPPFLSSGL